jgi:hypothetical protein
MKTTKKWPKWRDIENSKEDTLAMAKISTKYFVFLNPEIVSKITENNEEHRKEWSEGLKKKDIDPELYLWPKSPCAFPGVRRYAGKEERHNGKEKSASDPTIKYALKVDDNDFPKHLWSYSLLGQKFNNKGPEGFHLTHLADHNKDNLEKTFKKEFDIENPDAFDKPIYGLYTCCTNAIYTPKSLERLTDSMKDLRQLLFRKIDDLYYDCCKILPSNVKVKKNQYPEGWDIGDFVWQDPVGDLNNLNAFLDFRNEQIDKWISDVETNYDMKKKAQESLTSAIEASK